ncbi:LysM peptidoglycan-binding domain-containing protein [Aerophototrophica crusticola]|uniref:LysM peptidoglycan-binding domain-containing protein n=1 Tax=Aerophototrophica crusticola TaxID=1709002 RepID=A0A858R6P8_9PROT|nr:LysM peptidoglycan-binding domain-containing protein [Rhodospirillaceae bacterium B3]
MTAWAVGALVLAGCSTGQAPPVPSGGGANSIFVSQGDTVYTLAQQYRVPVRELIEANCLAAPYALSPGQRLILPVPRDYTVQPGDTVYAIARQFQVDMSALVRLNNIQPPYTIRAGQSLRLPASSPTPATTVAQATTRAPTPPPVARPSAPATSAPPTRATRLSVETEELAPPGGQPAPAAPSSNNGAPLPKPVPPPATPPVTSQPASRTVTTPPVTTAPTGPAPVSKRGMEAESLPPPSGSTASPAGQAAQAPTAPSSAVPPASRATPAPVDRPAAADPAPTATRPTPPPGQAPVPPSEAASQVAALPSTPPPRAGGRFAWPVRGPILSDYGPKPDGLRNDGINIGAPKGTPVKAADNGIVAYAGNQLRAFGNLVLVRHDGGLVTVYGHLDSMSVEQGQRVTKGQAIGTVGQTGNVRSPNSISACARARRR